MDIQITARHAKISAATRETVVEKINKVERFIEKITTCHVIVDNEHDDWLVEVVMQASGRTFSARALSDNLGKSLDDVVAKAQRQIKKANQKIKSHKGAKPEL